MLDLGIGAAIEFSDTDRAVRQLDAITWDRVNTWRSNALKVPEATWLETDDGARLNAALSGLV